MKNKIKITIASCVAIAILFTALSFRSSKSAGSIQYMQVTTIESIIPGGLGRSKMLITDETGKATDTEMENFYSLVGINFGNIKKNEALILAKINALSSQGWELVQVTAGTQSPSQGYEQGIYLTRYLFKKTN